MIGAYPASSQLSVTTMTMRAAIYARYSSENQRAASIDDQIEICRRHIASLAWEMGAVFTDAAVSGASAFRPGLSALAAAAERREFDVLVCESLDRLGRNLADVARFYDRLEFLGIGLHGVSTGGPITRVHIGLLGTMAQLQLSDLRDKTRRGLLGRVRAGRSAGGLAYGYAAVPPAPGSSEAGERRIIQEEAEIVRRIFRAFAAGESPRQIARQLNAEGVPGPGGRPWGDTTIRGQAARGTGILNNTLYVGRLEWNRCSYVKDPSTGRRVARVNPERARERTEVPALRIVDEALWRTVKQRQAALRETVGPTPSGAALNDARRTRFLLSGLLVCASCGGGFTIIGKDRYGCATRRSRGTCDNGATIGRQRIETRVLGAMRGHLLTPERAALAVRTLTEERDRQRKEADAARAGVQRQIGEVNRRLEGVLRAIEDGAWNATLKARLDELEARKTGLERDLALAGPEPVVTPHPNASELYTKKVGSLVESLNDPMIRTEAAEVLRGMIEKVVLTPDRSAPDGLTCELHGSLAAVLASIEPSGRGKRSRFDHEGQLSVVAGTRCHLDLLLSG